MDARDLPAGTSSKKKAPQTPKSELDEPAEKSQRRCFPSIKFKRLFVPKASVVVTHEPDDVPSTALSAVADQPNQANVQEQQREVTGDSEETFMDEEWGIKGTMHKIYVCIKEGVRPVLLHTLLSRGPTKAGLQRAITNRCTKSILILLRHGFIEIIRNPYSYEVIDITLGYRFTKQRFNIDQKGETYIMSIIENICYN